MKHTRGTRNPYIVYSVWPALFRLDMISAEAADVCGVSIAWAAEVEVGLATTAELHQTLTRHFMRLSDKDLVSNSRRDVSSRMQRYLEWPVRRPSPSGHAVLRIRPGESLLSKLREV